MNVYYDITHFVSLNLQLNKMSLSYIQTSHMAQADIQWKSSVEACSKHPVI